MKLIALLTLALLAPNSAQKSDEIQLQAGPACHTYDEILHKWTSGQCSLYSKISPACDEQLKRSALLKLFYQDEHFACSNEVRDLNPAFFLEKNKKEEAKLGCNNNLRPENKDQCKRYAENNARLEGIVQNPKNIPHEKIKILANPEFYK